jgi:cytosine/adenosine deaminase-related metal-dependent hydrolase
MKDDVAQKLRNALNNGDIDLLAIHIAEGKRTDHDSQIELAFLDSKQLLTSRTAVVHGTALSPGDFARMGQARSALVWSPRGAHQGRPEFRFGGSKKDKTK